MRLADHRKSHAALIPDLARSLLSAAYEIEGNAPHRAMIARKLAAGAAPKASAVVAPGGNMICGAYEVRDLIVLYELVSGRRVFDRALGTAAMRSERQLPIIPLSHFAPDTPEALDHIARFLSPEPLARFTSMRVVMERPRPAAAARAFPLEAATRY